MLLRPVFGFVARLLALQFATSFNSSDPPFSAVVAMFTASAMFILLGIGAALLLL